MTSEEKDSLSDLVQKMANELNEFADGVIVLVSASDGEWTELFHSSRGSCHTTTGMIQHYKEMKAQERLREKITEWNGDPEDPE